MSKKAEILAKMYHAGRVTQDGLRTAVYDGVITEAEYSQIVG